MTKILIYQDYVHNNGVLYKSLRTLFPKHDVHFCDADEIQSGILDDTVSLFVIPGGASLYYSEKLDGTPNILIREYIKNGGFYLGICAGAYYACTNIDWAKNTKYSIQREGNLNLYNGCATGPIQKFLEDGDIEKNWDYLASLKTDKILVKSLYRGGPIFEEPSKNSKVKVIARYSEYENEPPAILEGGFGNGKFILSSPHLEYSKKLYFDSFHSHQNPYKDAQKEVLLGWEDNEKPNLFLKELLERYF